MRINAYAAKSPHAFLEKFTYERDLESREIIVSIQYCSCTRGDIRFIDNHWNDTTYPFVPGLEIIGIVEKIGEDVKDVKEGDVVGIGYEVESCFTCDYCLAGKEQFCLKQKLIPINSYGGFADKIIVDYRFAFKMPDNLQSAESAPLLCSGLTTYTAITHCHVQAGMTVGVAGIGSLGHLAIQFLDKLGCDVTAFSHTESKDQVLKNLGAKTVKSTNELVLQKHERQFDFILSTSAATLPWSRYIKMLKPEGTLCFVGLPSEPISFKAELLADFAQRSIVGNYVGSRKDMKNMLNFAAKHNIRARAEIFPMKNINEVITKMKTNKISFSAVLHNPIV